MTQYMSWIALAVTLASYVLLHYLRTKRINFGFRTLIAMGIGLVIGFLFQGHTEYVSPFGRIFTQLIYVIVAPLLFFSIVSSIASLETVERFRSLGLKSVFWLLLNTAIASTLTVLVATTLKLGSGFSISLPTDYVPREVPAFLDTMMGFFPSNIAKHLAENQVIPIIILALMVGAALVKFRSKDEEAAKPMISFFTSANTLTYTMVKSIIALTPLAVVSYIANVPTRDGGKDLTSFVIIIVVAYALSFFQAFIVEGLLIKVFTNISLIKFFKAIWPAQIVAFVSQSSIGSVPVVVEQVTTKLGVKDDIAAFVAGLGANIGLPACTGIWPILLGVFSINALNIPFTTLQYFLLVVYTLIVGLGTAGVPGTATIAATAVLTAAGLPIEIIFVLSPISAIVDMARTMANVTGSATATVIVASRENAISKDPS